MHLVPSGSKYLKDEEQRLHGWCDHETCNIYIDKTLSEPAREDTLLHELLHACIRVTSQHVALEAAGESLEEDLVKAVTPTLHRLLCDLGFRFPRLA